MEAKVRRGKEECRAIPGGRDIYAVTASIVGATAGRLLATDLQVTGTAAPAEVFDTEAFLRGLSPEHISPELADSPAVVQGM